VRVNFLVNPQRLDAVQAAIEAVAFVRTRTPDVATEMETASLLGIPGQTPTELGHADLMVSFGGDGTLIRAADMCAEFGTPVLGVYFGRFGFVTQCQPSEVGACLSEFFDGQCRIEERMMLQAELIRGGEPVTTLHALNEIALQRSITARMMSFSVEVDRHFLTSYPADGFILSTPTGSTAYNLSAGGPILDPGVQAIVLTAVAPHTLSARPLVLRHDSEIILRVATAGDSILTVDGQGRLHVLSGDEVRVKRSPRVTKLVTVEPQDFLTKLSERLLWSQSILGGQP
jgi:NAD+ kinase